MSMRRLIAYMEWKKMLFVAFALTGSIAAMALGFVEFRDLPHTSLGQANVIREGIPPNDILTVGNIGTSGVDGVAIDVGQSVVWSGDFDQLSTLFAADGDEISATAVGQANGIPDQVLATIHLRRKGGSLIFDPDFPVSNGGALALELFDDRPAGRANNHTKRPNRYIILYPEDEFYVLLELFEQKWRDLFLGFGSSQIGGHSVCEWEMRPAVPVGTAFDVQVDGATYPATSMIIRTVPPDGPPPIDPVVDFTSEIRITAATAAAGGGSFTFVDESFVPASDSDGDGVDDASDNCVTVSNLNQSDTDGDNFGNVCDADLNNDCIVNIIDLGILRSVFFSNDSDADFDGNGVVNVVDLGIMRSLFFSPPGPSSLPNACTP